jgi:hypothetical protein
MLIFFVYLIAAIVSVFRKNGKAKKNFIVSGCLFWGSIILIGIGGVIGAKETVAIQSPATSTISPITTVQSSSSPDTKSTSAVTIISSPATTKPQTTISASANSTKPSPIPVSIPTPDQAIIEKNAAAATAKTEDKNNDVYYQNCTDAKSQGVYNIRKGDPGYRKDLDRDGDGIACEK